MRTLQAILASALLASCVNAPVEPMTLGMTWGEAKAANGGWLYLDSSYRSETYASRTARARGDYYTFEWDWKGNYVLTSIARF